MRLLALINPRAGSGRAARLQGKVTRAFESCGARVVWQRSAEPGQLKDFVVTADLRGFDAVVSAGGDGTLFEVLNGLCRREPSDRIPLGIVPLGTGNAFARDLGLGPDDWVRAIEIIASARTRWVDVGRIASGDDFTCFLNVTGAGLVVSAGQWAQRFKWAGRVSYTLGAICALAFLRSYRFAVDLDGEEVTEDGLLVEVSNSRFTGTHFLIAPTAKLDDGRLVVTLVRALSRRQVLRLLPGLYRGRHVEHPDVRVFKVRHVRIRAPEGLALTTDGEFGGSTPVDIRCLPRHLELFVPH